MGEPENKPEDAAAVEPEAPEAPATPAPTDADDPLDFQPPKDVDLGPSLEEAIKASGGVIPAKKDEDAAEEPEAGGEPAAPPAPEEPKVEIKPDQRFSDALQDQARSIGMSEEQMKVYDTPAQLEAAISLFDSRLAAAGKPPAAPAPAAPAAPAPAPGTTPAPAAAEPFDASKFDEIESPEVVATLKRLHEEVATMRTERATEREATKAREIAAITRDFEAVYEGLGPDWEPIFGKGPTHTLPVGSEERKAREAVEDQAAILGAGHESMKLPLPDVRVLAARAIRVVHGDHAQALARREVSRKLDDRAKGITTPPRRASAPPTPESEEKRTLAAATAAMQKAGWGDAMSEQLEGFPEG